MESRIVHYHPDSKPIQIRKVWAHNLHNEFFIIRRLIHRYPYVSIDTEFPGVIHKPDPSNTIPTHFRSPPEQYHIIKKNVDDLELIQLGLTLTDRDGNLPVSPDDDLSDWPVSCIWEFNFCDFDPERDPHNPNSISFLKSKGIDFTLNRELGIQSSEFGIHAIHSGILCNPSVTWVTFHSAYDFAYLVKILLRTTDTTCEDPKLPENLDMFLEILRKVFGPNVYDVKHVMQFSGLYCGLEKVASMLRVSREAGVDHHAAPDSLLIWRVFAKIWDKYFDDREADPKRHAGVLYGGLEFKEEIIEDNCKEINCQKKICNEIW